MAQNTTKLPVPIHESISDKHGKATPALVRYLNKLQQQIVALEKRIETLEGP